MRALNAAVLIAAAGASSAACASNGLRADYEAEAQRLAVASTSGPDLITEEDLAPLPPLVQRYLRRVEVLGKPHVRSFHATFEARIRSGPEEPWLTGPAEQYEFFDPPARLFYMKAHRAGLPVHVYHRYVGDSATMEGRLLGLFTVLDVSGPELTQAETVTLLNDMFFLAPAALVNAPIEWETLDDRRVRATYRNAGHTVSAIAYFNDDDDLVDFDSYDRYQVEQEPPRRVRWSTPLYEYGRFDGYRLATGGEARWGDPGEEWTYGDFRIQSIQYNVHREMANAAGDAGQGGAPLEELNHLPDENVLDAYYSDGFRSRGEQLARLVAGAVEGFQDSLGVRLQLKLAVLDREDWNRMPDAPPYGLPYIASVEEGSRLVVLPATDDGAVHNALFELEGTLSPEIRSNLTAAGLEWEEAARTMVDLIALHEVGHACASEYGVGRPSRWFDEFLASYLAYAYLRSANPELAEVWSTVSTAILEGHDPRHRTLEDFEELYTRVGVTDYAWYQAALVARTEALVRQEGLGFLDSARTLFPAGSPVIPPTDLVARLERKWPGFRAWSELFTRPHVRGQDLAEAMKAPEPHRAGAAGRAGGMDGLAGPRIARVPGAGGG